MIKSFFTGVRQASSNWKMIVLLLAANIIFALPLAVPIFLLMTQTAGGTLSAQKLFGDNLNVIWFSDLINEQFPGASPASIGFQIVAMLLVVGSVYLLVNTLLAGGIIEVFVSQDQRFSMRKFCTGCGAYFWRFFRLMIISVIFYGIAIGIFGLLGWLINRWDSKATVERPTAFRMWAAWLLLLILISL